MKKTILPFLVIAIFFSNNLLAQLGCGWTQYFPSKTIQERGSGSIYTNEGGIETFKMTNDGDERCEARIQDNYTSGTTQFEGYFFVEQFNGNNEGDDVCIAQVWLSMMMSVTNVRGGSMRQHSSYFADNLFYRWVRMNVYHNASTNKGEVWLDGVQVWTGSTKDSDPFYHKYGCYNQAENRPIIKWKNVKFFRNGTSMTGCDSKEDQTITFPALSVKTLCDADFNPGATASSGLTVSYTSSNSAVATIVSNKVHIVGIGTTDICANQAGNSDWNPAPAVCRTLTVTACAPSEKIWIDAESGTITSPMTVQTDANASGCKYIVSSSNSQTAPPATGQSVLAFNAAGGSYKIWARTLMPTTANNSFWIQVDGGAWISWNDNAYVSTSWSWNPVTTLSLGAGAHTIIIAYREAGSKMDRLLISSDAAYTPSGLGENAPSCSTFDNLALEAESGVITAPMGVLSDATASGGKYIRVAAGNNSQSVAPANGSSVITFTAKGGAYKIWAKTLMPTSANNSFWFKIDNGAWFAWNDNAFISTVWQWNLVTSVTLTAGTHTLTVAYREEGSKMDRIAISNDPAFNPATILKSVDAAQPDAGSISLSCSPTSISGSATISYQTSVSATVRIVMYNVNGQSVKTLVDAYQEAGQYSLPIDAAGLKTGIYVVKLVSGNTCSTIKVLVE